MKAKLFLFAVLFAVPAFAQDQTASEGPRVLCLSSMGGRAESVITNANTATAMLRKHCPTCRITSNREAADYVIEIVAAVGGGAWTLYDKNGDLLKEGTPMFPINGVKDAAKFLQSHYAQRPKQDTSSPSPQFPN
jgi:hypothetical protein